MAVALTHAETRLLQHISILAKPWGYRSRQDGAHERYEDSLHNELSPTYWITAATDLFFRPLSDINAGQDVLWYDLQSKFKNRIQDMFPADSDHDERVEDARVILARFFDGNEALVQFLKQAPYVVFDESHSKGFRIIIGAGEALAAFAYCEQQTSNDIVDEINEIRADES